MGFLSGLLDPGNFFGGNEGGVSLSGIFDPLGSALNSAGAMPDIYDRATNGIDEWAGDMYDFEKNNFSNMWKKFKNDPTQLLIGAGDPFSAKMWGGITGKDYEPYVNQLGGATEKSFQDAEKEGIDTGAARGAHKIAGAIASYYGGGALGSAFGTAGQAAGIGAGAGQALGGAAVGAGNAWAQDGNIGQGLVTGGLGGYLGNMDYGSYLGDYMDNPYLRSGFNGAVGGGLNSAISGGNSSDILTGAGLGAAKGVGGSIYNNYNSDNEFDALPGTVGGTAQDEYGESSATMGGQMLPVQQQANDQRAQALGASRATASPSMVDDFISAITPSAAAGGGKGLGAYGDLAGQALGLYDAYRGRRRAREQAAGLQNLFTPNSPYAQQMRQRLERQDAAAGRRSQYGTREVELAAKLAEMQARQAPQLQSLYNEENAARNRMLSNGLRLGTGLYKLYGQ